VQSYGLISLRAAIVASDHGLLREFSRAAFARNFASGLVLTSLEDVCAVADEVGLDSDAVSHGVASQEIKDRLASATDAAIATGLPGVPGVLVAGQSFWGDDQLETAAAAIGGGGSWTGAARDHRRLGGLAALAATVSSSPGAPSTRGARPPPKRQPGARPRSGWSTAADQCTGAGGPGTAPVTTEPFTTYA
jgi:hypothetical protein